MKEIEITYTGKFTRGKIRKIAEVHPELGNALAATAYLGAAISPDARTRIAPSSKTVVADDSVYRLNQRKASPGEDTNLRRVVDELVKQFGKGEFMYINVKEAVNRVGANSGLPAHLRNDRFIIPA